MRRAFLLPFLLIPLGAAAEDLARDPQWLRLLHYRRGVFGFRSQVDGPNFFLSPRGKSDPAAELKATLEAFAEPLPVDFEAQHPQCRFPARYEWLKSRLGSASPFPAPVPCPRLDQWLSKMDPGGASLIYASAYLNNPASMYGHTFLRVEPAGERAETPLLAYSVNFAAETDETNGLMFAVKGLFGGYPGKFSTHPFYMKVQQYTNMESRDLWEYRLSLSSETARRLLLHSWELGPTWFDYYFLTENCSYQLFPLMEAVDPSISLSRKFHFKAIPVDTLRVVLETRGLVLNRTLRPSALRRVMARRALLTKAELSLAEEAFRDLPAADAALSVLPEERRLLVLDSAHDLARLRHRFARYPTPAQEEVESALLSRRGKIPLPSPDVTAAMEASASPPEAGHLTGRLGAGGGKSGGKGFAEVSLRGAMHDFEEDPAGYLPGSRLEMFHLRLRRYEGRPGGVVHRYAGVDILSLSPRDRWVRKPSWKIFLGWDTPLDRLARPGGGGMGRALGGSGLSWGDGLKGRMAYAFVGMDAGVGGVLPKGYRLGWEGETGAFLSLGPTRWHGTLFRRRYFWGEPSTVDGVRGTISLSLGRRWETRFSGTREGRRREVRWMLQLYV